MGKRTDDLGPADRDVYGPSPLRLQFDQNQSDRGVGGSSDRQGPNATFSISRASWLSYSSTQAGGPSTAIACGSATPEFPPEFSVMTKKFGDEAGRYHLDKTVPRSQPADWPVVIEVRSDLKDWRTLPSPEGRPRWLWVAITASSS